MCSSAAALVQKPCYFEVPLLIMDVSRQLLFFFSALGAFNGLLLSIYFAFLIKDRKPANYFLGALLLVVSTRIAKSVFLHFNSANISQGFIQIGLSALILIGPLLYLYIDRTTGQEDEPAKPANWLLHLLPFMIIIAVFNYYYPYWENRENWGQYISMIYYQWLIYILFSAYKLRHHFKRMWHECSQLTHDEIWVLSVFGGITVIWLAYRTSSYTSYIVGALSFSFVLYLLLLLWLLREKSAPEPTVEPVDKYVNKKIESEEAKAFDEQLQEVMMSKKLHDNPNLKLSDVADELNVPTHYLSQFINDNLGKNFPLFVNEFRIDAAKSALISEDHLTLEAIGYDSGFNSKSTFFTTFKKITGMTPAAYRKQVKKDN